MIESNESIFLKFNSFIHSLVERFSLRSRTYSALKNYVVKVGGACKKNEWKNSYIIDLSTMPEDNIVINTFNDGSSFNTNIKTLDNNTLLYGSIRPYFHKCGFTVDINYVAGTVHSFKTVDKKMYFWVLGIICSEEFHKHTNTKSQGTKMPIINWDSLTNYDIPLLNSEDLNRFNSIIEPLYNIVIEKMRQNRKLNDLKQQYLKKFFG